MLACTAILTACPRTVFALDPFGHYRGPHTMEAGSERIRQAVGAFIEQYEPEWMH